jgi:transposase-like protein
MSEQHCLRCKAVRLVRLPESGERMSFFECPRCGRHFARQEGGGLTERWLGPISLLLYPVIFSPKPVDEVDRVIAHLVTVVQWPRDRIEQIIDEVTLELEEPTQQVRQILDMKASEEDAREYLRLMVAGLRAIDPAQYPSVTCDEGRG